MPFGLILLSWAAIWWLPSSQWQYRRRCAATTRDEKASAKDKSGAVTLATRSSAAPTSMLGARVSLYSLLDEHEHGCHQWRRRAHRGGGQRRKRKPPTTVAACTPSGCAPWCWAPATASSPPPHSCSASARHALPTNGAVLLFGLAGLVADACSLAIGEYVSVHAQLDVELAEIEPLPRRPGSGWPVTASGGGSGVAPRPGRGRGDIVDTRRLLPPACSRCSSSLWRGSSTAGGRGALQRKRSSTARHPLQAYYLRRLAHTLRLAPSPLLWLVVESGAATRPLLAQRRLFCSLEEKKKNCRREGVLWSVEVGKMVKIL
uniref:Uncharacterized protein n=1 Tax=Oryza meridionalis TaxID=40149 RepID=A0A0E0CSN5_9ORYZ